MNTGINLGRGTYMECQLPSRLIEITWLFARIRTWPVTEGPDWSLGFSIDTLARASSPKILRAYKLAAIKPQSPAKACRSKNNLLRLLRYLKNNQGQNPPANFYNQPVCEQYTIDPKVCLP